MAQDSLIGKMLANFRVDSHLGQGGMAVVYKGMDVQLERPVAIKLINAQFQSNPEYAERFVSEAKLVARWRHENIISVYYADKQDDLYYFVMEFIDGATLEDLMRLYLSDGDLMPYTDAIRIGRATAAGLDYAHKQGVVHRDVKPANIMISRDDRVVVTDFGLALDMGQGSMGQIFGTPHYVAPEQVRHSADASPQSDVYSLGIVMYEMVTGTLPFDDPSATAIAVQHLTEPPPLPRMMNPALNQQTEDVLLKALSKDPADRYETASAFIDALELALSAPSDERETEPDIVFPAAITKRTGEFPKISHMSISEMLELELAQSKPPVAPPVVPTVNAEHRQETQQSPARKKKINTVARPDNVDAPPPRKNANMPLFAGIGVVVIVVIAIAFFMLNGAGDNGDISEVSIASTNDESADALDLTNEAIATSNAEMSSTDTVIDLTNEAIEASNEEILNLTGTANAQATSDAIALVTQTAQMVYAQATGDTIAIATQTVSARATADAEVIIQSTNAQTTLDAIVAETQSANALATSNALVATQSANALATSNAQMEATLTQQANAPVNTAPTVVFPSGRLLELTYNSAGFYLRNISDSGVESDHLAFQALDASGNGIGVPFDGETWKNVARGYNYIDQSNCASIELFDQDNWNRPNTCTSYNARSNLSPTDTKVFWIGQYSATQFAVFWDGVEIARCEIAIGSCLVRVGS